MNLLVSDSAVVLEDIIISGTGCLNKLLQGGLREEIKGYQQSVLIQAASFQLSRRVGCLTYQDFGELVIGNVGKFGTVELGNNELGNTLQQPIVSFCYVLVWVVWWDGER